MSAQKSPETIVAYLPHAGTHEGARKIRESYEALRARLLYAEQSLREIAVLGAAYPAQAIAMAHAYIARYEECGSCGGGGLHWVAFGVLATGEGGDPEPCRRCKGTGLAKGGV